MIDGRAMDGVTSFRIHSGPDMTQVRTETFIMYIVDFMIFCAGALLDKMDGGVSYIHSAARHYTR